MKKYLIFTLFFCFFAPVFGAEVKTITLKQCQADAIASSPALKQKAALKDAALYAYESSGAALYPTLSLDGKGGWVSQVPTLQIGPISAEFGDNWSYSAGPTINYILFDNGGRSDVKRSMQAVYFAKQKDYDFALKTVLLDVRQAYFTVQQDLERMYFTDGQLKVAQKQLQDIQAAFKAGAKSNIDVYMATKQKLRAQVNISASRGALGAHLRNLFSLTGTDYGIDANYPLDWRIKPYKGEDQPSALVKADGLESTLTEFKEISNYDFDKDLPALAALLDMAGYYESIASGLISTLYPTVALNAGAYWEYPNGPIKEDVFNAKAGAGIKIPLFEGGKSRKSAASNKAQAKAALFEKQGLEQKLSKLFYSSKSSLYALGAQEAFTKDMIAASNKTAQLTYQAYKAGAVTFLEVDNANLALLESQIALADIFVQRLNSLAVMDNLGRGI